MPFSFKNLFWIFLEQIRNHIEQVNSSSNQDTLSVYGSYMPGLIKEIQKLYERGKFSELPRGPVGRYIEVLDEKWKSYIELTLGSTMTGFLVNNQNDQNVLNDLITKQFPAARRLPIYTGKFSNQVNFEFHLPFFLLLPPHVRVLVVPSSLLGGSGYSKLVYGRELRGRGPNFPQIFFGVYLCSHDFLARGGGAVTDLGFEVRKE